MWAFSKGASKSEFVVIHRWMRRDEALGFGRPSRGSNRRDVPPHALYQDGHQSAHLDQPRSPASFTVVSLSVTSSGALADLTSTFGGESGGGVFLVSGHGELIKDDALRFAPSDGEGKKDTKPSRKLDTSIGPPAAAGKPASRPGWAESAEALPPPIQPHGAPPTASPRVSSTQVSLVDEWQDFEDESVGL